MALTVLFTYFTYSICANQIRRFLGGPIVVSLEKDYRNWVYEPMAITICTDFVNKSVMHEMVERYAKVDEDCDPDSYKLYRQYFELIGSLNADNLHLIGEFEDTDFFANLTGDDLLSIAIEVSRSRVNCIQAIKWYFDWFVQLKQPILWDSLFQPVMTEAGICYSTMKIYDLFEITPIE